MGFHCRLEFVPGLEFLSCETSHVPENPADTHCDDNACRTLEAGHFVRAADQWLPQVPETAVPSSSFTLKTEPSAFVISALLSTVPPDLPKTWQFSHRAALPPRAPSSAV